jgi:hypothetical protein
LHREGKRRRGEESVAQLCPIYFNIQNRLDEPKSVKLIYKIYLPGLTSGNSFTRSSRDSFR